MEAVKKTQAAKWGGKIPSNINTPLRDGDVDRPDQEEYAGMYFLNASTKQKPGVVDAQLNPILDPTEVYSGCYGRASINFFAYNGPGTRDWLWFEPYPETRRWRLSWQPDQTGG